MVRGGRFCCCCCCCCCFLMFLFQLLLFLLLLFLFCFALVLVLFYVAVSFAIFFFGGGVGGEVGGPFVTLLPTTVEIASCKVHTLLCTGWLPTTLISIVLVVAVLLEFASRSAFDDHYIGHPIPQPPPPPPPPPPSPPPSHLCLSPVPKKDCVRFLWTLSPSVSQSVKPRERGDAPVSQLVNETEGRQGCPCQSVRPREDRAAPVSQSVSEAEGRQCCPCQ